ALLVLFHLALPPVDRGHGGQHVHARRQAALHQRAADALGVLGLAHGGEDDQASRHFRPRSRTAFHCGGVSGTTDSRPCRTSGLSAKAGMALISASVTGTFRRPSGSRSTTTSRASPFFGSA